MRILYLCLDQGVPVGGGKGSSVHVAEMVEALAANGHEVTVAARSVVPDGPTTPSVRVVQVAGRQFPVGGELALAAEGGSPLVRRIRSLIREIEPDVVYERYSLWRWEGLRAARTVDSRGVPTVLEVNSPLSYEARRFRGHRLTPVSAALERRIWRQATLVSTVSHPLADRVRACGQPNVVVVPNAVNSRQFVGRVDEGFQLRDRLGLSGHFVIAWVGTPRPWHDLLTVVDAVGRLPSMVNAALMLVGEGDGRAEVVARASEAGVHLVAPGAVPHSEVPNYLAASDVCVVSLPTDPKLSYFSPLKAMEYLAAGRPTVVAEAGDLTTLVSEQVALGFRPGDAASLAARLKELALDSRLRERLSEEGSRYAFSWSWSDAARAWIRALESPTGQSPAGALVQQAPAVEVRPEPLFAQPPDVLGQ